MKNRIHAGLAVLLAVALLGVLGWSIQRAGAAPGGPALLQDQPTPVFPDPSQGGAMRERDGDESAPLISFIDSPEAQCTRPKQYTNACYIQWRYLSVTAASTHYVISMTVSINDRLRAYFGGFFQTSMYVPQEIQTPGFRVACGTAGASGNPSLGQSYSWAVRARETSGLSSGNYGTVYCPADAVPASPAALSGPTNGLTNHPYSFTASAAISSTLPITYVWTVTGKGVITVTNGLNDTHTYNWGGASPKQVKVDLINAAGKVTLTRTVTIKQPTIYLPVLAR
jgi:hypothetical protein